MNNLEDFLSQINMMAVLNHYSNRNRTHDKLIKFFKENNVEDYFELAIGYKDGVGNYSASEHQLDGKLYQSVKPTRIYEFAQEVYASDKPLELPKLIYKKYNLPYLKISVGSEIAMMLKPNTFWLANVRSIWTHLLVKHSNSEDFLENANEELKLYRTQDGNSEMEYQMWKHIYSEMPISIDKALNLSNEIAKSQNVPIGENKYLWFDCIANHLYENYTNA